MKIKKLLFGVLLVVVLAVVVFANIGVLSVANAKADAQREARYSITVQEVTTLDDRVIQCAVLVGDNGATGLDCDW